MNNWILEYLSTWVLEFFWILMSDLVFFWNFFRWNRTKFMPRERFYSIIKYYLQSVAPDGIPGTEGLNKVVVMTLGVLTLLHPIWWCAYVSLFQSFDLSLSASKLMFDVIYNQNSKMKVIYLSVVDQRYPIVMLRWHRPTDILQFC